MIVLKVKRNINIDGIKGDVELVIINIITIVLEIMMMHLIFGGIKDLHNNWMNKTLGSTTTTIAILIITTTGHHGMVII